MVRVVLDTNILVSACLTPGGAPATIVELALLGGFTLCVSYDVVVEYREVLARAKFSRQHERIGVLLEGIREIATTVRPEETVSISPDEEDNRLLECAQSAQADFLVTGNPRHFPASFGSTRIISARDFLTELGF
jgi:putative PIN family toxin of toxin-antitoxin system